MGGGVCRIGKQAWVPGQVRLGTCWGPVSSAIRRLKARRVAVLQHHVDTPIDWLAALRQARHGTWPVPSSTRTQRPSVCPGKRLPLRQSDAAPFAPARWLCPPSAAVTLVVT